jgi:predicted nucleotidyltransferase component of viral defense system
VISHSEIRNLEVEWGLREDVIEKDYVLGWLLWGIGSDPVLREGWLFKGGTCLKKCFFETYRFSEDLDFTVLPECPISPDEVSPLLAAILRRVSEESGIDFNPSVKMKMRPNGYSAEIRIYYRGPRMTPSYGTVKVDLNGEEQVARPPVLRPISHPFKEMLPAPANVRCYSFEELFAEKTRALGERCRPRDLYDVVNLYRRSDLRRHAGVIRSVLIEKCRSKGVSVPTFAALEKSSTRIELHSEWANMLAHQLPNLPPIESFWSELDSFFVWLEGGQTPPVLLSIAIGKDEDAGWAPPPTVYAWGQGVPMEPVRFAGTNRLCIEIRYRKESGEVTDRMVEPYALRRTLDRKIILHAVDIDDKALCTFRVDRILNLKVTTRPFNPRYEIEFAGTKEWSK